MSTDKETRHNWMTDAFFGIHYDLHANANDTELGRELTPEHLKDRLQKIKPDWIHCDCKGHAGYTSWPTRVGSTSPGVVKDGLKIHRDVTRELGISLGMHYSGVWDSRAVELHPEWAVIDADGTPSPNNTCRLSPYVDELMIPQMKEIIDNYGVDNFWVDGENWASTPCWCERCTGEFTRRTGIGNIPEGEGDSDWATWLAFHRDVFIEYITHYTDAMHAHDPECLICSNWLYTARQPEPITAPVDYISGDFDHAFGADRAAIEGRVMDARGLPWNLMAWAFAKTGTMGESPGWAIKTATHLCQEISEVLALGGGVMVYNQPQRTSWLTGWHNDILAQVSEYCQMRRNVCFRSETFPEAAVLHLADAYYTYNAPLFNYGEALHPVEGALHAFLENHWSTDVLNEDAALQRLHRYPVAVVPEQTPLSPEMQSTLEQYVLNGGTLLLSGVHLANEMSDFTGVSSDGDPISNTYLASRGEVTPATGPWQPVQLRDADAWTCHMKQQDPEKDVTEIPAITTRRLGKGTVAAIHGPIFRDYHLGHYPRMRHLIGDLLEFLSVERKVDIKAPPYLEMVLRRKGDAFVIHLINRGASEMLHQHRVILEDLNPIHGVVLHIRCTSKPSRITLSPGDEICDWTYDNGVVTATLPPIEIHTALVVEE